MASTNRRVADDTTDRPSKRHKQGSEKGTPAGFESTSADKSNPYLAHMFDKEEPFQNGNGESRDTGDSLMKGFIRHQTTAKMAHAVEDGPLNPFNGKPLSKRYFDILETRRNLPVHLQR